METQYIAIVCRGVGQDTRRVVCRSTAASIGEALAIIEDSFTEEAHVMCIGESDICVE